MATAHKIDGGWVVSDGFWLPGVFNSEAAALAWAATPDDVLAEAWERSKPEPLGMPPTKEANNADSGA